MSAADRGVGTSETTGPVRVQPTAQSNPLPRAVRRGGPYVLLDGEWRFELDLHDVGLREEWYRGHRYSGTINWPTSVESVMEEAADTLRTTGQLGPEPHDAVIAWYERYFEVPPEWLYTPNALVQLTFGACGFETRVWLNGHPLRTVEGEETHLGEYTSFSYELPPHLLEPNPAGPHRLTVRTADDLDAEIPRGKQESRVYKRGGIWYQTISGPVRSVWIEPVMSNRLRSRMGVVSTIEDRLVEFTLTTRVRDEGEYLLRLSVSGAAPTWTDHLGSPPDGPAESSGPGGPDPFGVGYAAGGDQLIASQEVSLRLRAGERRQRVAVQMPQGARLWGPSPHSPHLYRVAAELVDPIGATSRVEARFGLRKIEARGRRIYLNNQPIYLDGILYQPSTSTFAETVRHMEAIKALGCNLVRVHITGVDPRIYEVADEMGLLLWVEVPSPHSSSQRSRDHHWAELMRLLSVISTHPSVVILSLYNEDWGVQDIAYNALTREYIARTHAYLRVNYPQLLVVDNDGWRHVCTEGRLESDLLTAHYYTPDLEDWRSGLDRLAAGELHGITAEPLVVGDPFFYSGQVPIVVSEWGGFGWSGYGGPQATGERSRLIREFKQELRSRPFAGDVYTQATSIEEEVNGLIEPKTGELLVEEGVLGPSPHDT